ncbi:hypothetical protein EDC01DRAFT_611815 [Geopyxis carbonaria]|nr:hypothetical protein EDC01DRAFT_611815 [Geopyxis carbonaria]
MKFSDPKSHTWLVLSDSALPLGSFAFSSGLESYIAHNRAISSTPSQIVARFISVSTRALSSTTLPFVISTYEEPGNAAIFDDELDASITCNVARRASTSQGRALLTVWDKSLSNSVPEGSIERGWMETYRISVKNGDAGGHFGVSWGLICRAFALKVDEVCYVFLFNHVKAVLSASVRLGFLGPYHSQGILIQESTQKLIREAIIEGCGRSKDEIGQTTPTLDIYQGRHELLYSRVFNA